MDDNNTDSKILMTKTELRKSLDFVNEERERLQQENERLKDTLNKIMASDGETTTPILDLIKEKEDYKSRIEKAVEYIKHCPEYLWNNVNTKVLLNILEGKE